MQRPQEMSEQHNMCKTQVTQHKRTQLELKSGKNTNEVSHLFALRKVIF